MAEKYLSFKVWEQFWKGTECFWSIIRSIDTQYWDVKVLFGRQYWDGTEEQSVVWESIGMRRILGYGRVLFGSSIGMVEYWAGRVLGGVSIV